MPDAPVACSNTVFSLQVDLQGGRARARLKDAGTGFDWADGPLLHRAERADPDGTLLYEGPREPVLRARGDTITITGMLAGLELTHTLTLPADRPWLEERITLRNAGREAVRLQDFRCSFTRRITDTFGNVLPELRNDKLAAVPFRHRAADPSGTDRVMELVDLLRLSAQEPTANAAPITWPSWGSVPGRGWGSEGWAWERGDRALGIFKFNQEGMEQSVIAAMPSDPGLSADPGHPEDHGASLCFGGAASFAGDPSALRSIAPGQTLDLGVTRFVSVPDDNREAWYAFRSFLDEHGCRFPSDFDPPVHWNELYDNPEWNLGSAGKPSVGPTRQVTYTRDLIELEAAKAVEYGCQSLYLDPGWDTALGTFLWGEKWLGPRKGFIDKIRTKYGLGLSLHCPLGTWTALDGRGTSAWPAATFQMRKDGTVVPGAICLGSRQYVDEAEKRLLAHCADGVGFLMFDGNWWNGGCWNRAHGHPVPYTMEDHARAQVDLARRIHARHPKVLIEMHDMISGGVMQRHTPVYYKHGVPGSFDESWGFELMWQPMEDILAGRARSLYWYNLGCNVPVYLHIDLRDDNEHCLVLWWYASTCRHLGIGGTHSSPRVAAAQKEAMKTYRRLDRFYKRGAFLGMHEEAHVHALPAENAFIVNLFNCSGAERIVDGSISVAAMGLDPDRWFVCPRGGRFDRSSGTFVISRRLAPWSADVAEVRSVQT